MKKIQIVVMILLSLMAAFQGSMISKGAIGPDIYKAYLEVLQNDETGVRKLEPLRNGTDLELGTVIFVDVIGDELPEMIYSTSEDIIGVAPIGMHTSLEYTHEAVFHILTYDYKSERAVSVMSYNAGGFNDQGEYTSLGIWPGAYYVIDGEKPIYYKCKINWSGNTINSEELQYNENSKAMEVTDQVMMNGGSAGDPRSINEIRNPNIQNIMNYTPNPGVRLLFDAYGKSDFVRLTYDSAIQLLASETGLDTVQNNAVINFSETNPSSSMNFYVKVNADTGNVNFRTDAGTGTSVIAEIPNGTELQITDLQYNSNDGFLFGKTVYRGNSGWISLRQTTILEGNGYPTIDFTVAVTAEAGLLNFRQGAGTGYAVIQEIPNGTILRITNLQYNSADNYFFGQTSYNGYIGWVSIRQTTIQRPSQP